VTRHTRRSRSRSCRMRLLRRRSRRRSRTRSICLRCRERGWQMFRREAGLMCEGGKAHEPGMLDCYNIRRVRDYNKIFAIKKRTGCCCWPTLRDHRTEGKHVIRRGNPGWRREHYCEVRLYDGACSCPGSCESIPNSMCSCVGMLSRP